MDCTSVRWLAPLARIGELDEAEQQALNAHFAGCPECWAMAQAHNRLDDALATAMHRVPIPSDLKGRILERLARARRPRRWRWAAAAAVTFAAVVTGYFVVFPGPDRLDLALLTEKVDLKATAESVENWFDSQHGISMTAPRNFNYNFLDSFDVAEVQGHRVAKLTFLSQNRTVLAHVYVLSARQFSLPAELDADAAFKEGWLGDISVPASTHAIFIRPNSNVPDFFYLIVSTSRALDPLLLEGI
jgi:hypothetical protein